eukprot:100776-Prymnesium_polylepis.1
MPKTISRMSSSDSSTPMLAFILWKLPQKVASRYQQIPIEKPISARAASHTPADAVAPLVCVKSVAH